MALDKNQWLGIGLLSGFVLLSKRYIDSKNNSSTSALEPFYDCCWRCIEYGDMKVAVCECGVCEDCEHGRECDVNNAESFGVEDEITVDEMNEWVKNLGTKAYFEFCYRFDIDPEDAQEMSWFIADHYDEPKVINWLEKNQDKYDAESFGAEDGYVIVDRGNYKVRVHKKNLDRFNRSTMHKIHSDKHKEGLMYDEETMRWIPLEAESFDAEKDSHYYECYFDMLDSKGKSIDSYVWSSPSNLSYSQAKKLAQSFAKKVAKKGVQPYFPKPSKKVSKIKFYSFKKISSDDEKYGNVIKSYPPRKYPPDIMLNAESFSLEEGQEIPNLTIDEWTEVSGALGKVGTFHNWRHEGRDGEGGNGTTLVVNKRHGVFGRRNKYECDSCGYEYSSSMFPDGFNKHEPISFCEYCLDKEGGEDVYGAESFGAEDATRKLKKLMKGMSKGEKKRISKMVQIKGIENTLTEVLENAEVFAANTSFDDSEDDNKPKNYEFLKDTLGNEYKGDCEVCARPFTLNKFGQNLIQHYLKESNNGERGWKSKKNPEGTRKTARNLSGFFLYDYGLDALNQYVLFQDKTKVSDKIIELLRLSLVERIIAGDVVNLIEMMEMQDEIDDTPMFGKGFEKEFGAE